jgi:hypothetical protein
MASYRSTLAAIAAFKDSSPTGAVAAVCGI